jgi:MoxR-like ATPase
MQPLGGIILAANPNVIRPDEHVFIAGRNGTGKTFLARAYLSRFANVAVLDNKGLFQWPEVEKKELTIVTRLADLLYLRTPKVIYRPRWEEQKNEYWDAFYQWAYRRMNTAVLTDEIFSVCPRGPMVYPEYLKAILTRGRERRVAHWGLTQRPASIPIVCMSEAMHIFSFSLNIEEDRKRLRAITGAEEFLQRVDGHRWWYFKQDGTMNHAVKGEIKVIRERGDKGGR